MVPLLLGILQRLLQPADPRTPQQAAPAAPGSSDAQQQQQQAGPAASCKAAGSTDAGSQQQGHTEAGEQLPAAACSTSSSGLPVAYIATTLRNEATLALFLQQAAGYGLQIEEVPWQPQQQAAPPPPGEGAHVRFHHVAVLAARGSVLVHAVRRRQ
jgi:hypothetical protein